MPANNKQRQNKERVCPRIAEVPREARFAPTASRLATATVSRKRKCTYREWRTQRTQTGTCDGSAQSHMVEQSIQHDARATA